MQILADTDPLNECVLECANTGYFEREDWKNIFCKTVDNITSWYTKNDERVTLQMIKDENLCNGNEDSKETGLEEKGSVCHLPFGPETDGGCEAFFRMYSFDGSTCVEWIYGGCGGNENMFETKEECEKVCSGE